MVFARLIISPSPITSMFHLSNGPSMAQVPVSCDPGGVLVLQSPKWSAFGSLREADFNNLDDDFTWMITWGQFSEALYILLLKHPR